MKNWMIFKSVAIGLLPDRYDLKLWSTVLRALQILGMTLIPPLLRMIVLALYPISVPLTFFAILGEQKKRDESDLRREKMRMGLLAESFKPVDPYRRTDLYYGADEMEMSRKQ